MLDLSENHLLRMENLSGLGLQTLHLAQNRLASLEGATGLQQLQVLNVRHNNISSLSALEPSEAPRLRRLCVSENRITSIEDVAGLQGFPILSDLQLAPNPVEELPHYRAQVLHRLSHLRCLDNETATAEEKVKADLIYGADIQDRQNIFEQLLPEETFVDRRLITKEGIADAELEEFGQEGEVGPFGRAAADGPEDELVGKPPMRSCMQEAKFRQRLEQACRGGDPPAVSDFANYAAPFAGVPIFDRDLPAILEAVTEGSVEELLLGAAQLTASGVLELLSFLQKGQGTLLHIDLAGCNAVREVGKELVAKFPYAIGRSLEVAGCGLSDQDTERLRNRTPEAERARRRAAEDRKRASNLVLSYLAGQAAKESGEDDQGDAVVRRRLAALVSAHFRVAAGRETAPPSGGELAELYRLLNKDGSNSTKFLRTVQRVLDESWRGSGSRSSVRVA